MHMLTSNGAYLTQSTAEGLAVEQERLKRQIEDVTAARDLELQCTVEAKDQELAEARKEALGARGMVDAELQGERGAVEEAYGKLAGREGELDALRTTLTSVEEKHVAQSETFKIELVHLEQASTAQWGTGGQMETNIACLDRRHLCCTKFIHEGVIKESDRLCFLPYISGRLQAREELSKVSLQLKRALTVCEKAKTARDETREELTRTSDDLAGVRSALEAAQEQAAHESAATGAVRAELAKTSEALMSVRAELDAAQSEVRAAKQAAQEAEDRAAAMQEAADKATQDAEVARGEAAAARQQAEAAGEDQSAALQEAQAARDETAAAGARAEAACAERERALQDVAAAQAEAAAAQQRAEEATAKHNDAVHKHTIQVRSNFI